MKRLLAGIVILFMVVGLAYAQDRGTSAEAKALLDKAVAFYRQVIGFGTGRTPNGPRLQGGCDAPRTTVDRRTRSRFAGSTPGDAR